MGQCDLDTTLLFIRLAWTMILGEGILDGTWYALSYLYAKQESLQEYDYAVRQVARAMSSGTLLASIARV